MFGILFAIGMVYLIINLLYIGVLYENSLIVPVEPQTKIEYRVIIIREKIKWLQLNTPGFWTSSR